MTKRKIPVATCPKCGAHLTINISDKDILEFLRQRLSES